MKMNNLHIGSIWSSSFFGEPRPCGRIFTSGDMEI